MKSGMFRVAIVGAATLKGKEVADVLNDRNFPSDVRLLDDEESLGQLEAVGEEVSFVQSVARDQFTGVDFAFFASEEAFTKRNWVLAKDAGCAIIDLSYALENEPGATVRSPWLERELSQPITPELQPAPVIAAHPAAQVLALLLTRAAHLRRLRTVAAVVIEPASEHGRRGMDELHEQTVNLLSFRELPKQVFDAQVAFNMIARYGEKSSPTMESVEARILRHFKKITAEGAVVPSLMLVQAPSFHGHAFSVYIETDDPASAGDLAQALTGDHVTVARVAEDSPSNVNAAGQEGILVSVRRDAERENGFWLWAAADNLRVIANTAVECAESLMAARPKGKVQ
ncbi:MAG TPA: Asd/ArgC dimerization domain-containing protein [Terriglobales bacterium]|nr:Asd/ArgC dimerization domain-containing protein [Terriglobales bacterium]